MIINYFYIIIKGIIYMNYSDSEKSAIVAEYKQGIPVKGLSVKYEVSERTIYRWVKE